MESQRNRFRSPLLLTAGILVSLLAVSLWGSLALRPGLGSDGPVLALGSATPASLPGGPPETLFSRVFEALSPSVVFLTVEDGGRTRTGSGLVVHQAGFIVTNAHVVRGAGQVTVALDSGRDLVAEIWGADRRTDVAVLKVDATEPLLAASLGDSDSLKVGEFVMALGAPFNLRATGTRGIVSGLNKRGLGIATIERFIVTDAAINRGNSGGPLVNARGDVVGINTAMISGDGTEQGGFSGVGFAIPINLVVEVASGLIGDGGLTLGWIGVDGEALDEGILLVELHEDGPAAAAGLQEGDLVVALDGEQLGGDRKDLRRRIMEMSPGTAVEVGVLRAGQRRTFEVTVENWPADLAIPAPERAHETAEDDDDVGDESSAPGVVQVRGLDESGHVVQVGSGVVLDTSGRILTNAHVVVDVDRVEVVVPGRPPRPARRNATDRRIDLALVTVEDAPSLTTARLGDSGRVGRGDPVTAVRVLADGTVERSRGRILNTDHERSGYSKWVGLLLTDAPTEEGYSGGPLLDPAGRVVGVLIAADPGKGQSLAIPVDTASWAARQLREHGRVVRSTMRVAMMSDMNPGLVVNVYPGGPGEAAGLQQNDRVIAANGSEIEDYEEWMRAVSRMEPGSSLRLDVLRGSETLEVELILEEEPAEQGELSAGS